MAGRILVLDDEENYAEMLRDLLRDNNYRVDMATRPERAIDQLEEIPYDLVISDYKMPVMDGADFLQKSRELYPNLPFILVSGLMNTPELVKVANMSVTLVMEKPVDTDAFLRQVARFSEPMTDEEKLALEKELESNASAEGESRTSYPEEPRFFKAVSSSGKRFMQQAWSIALEASELFILERESGDGELAAKDISEWRGNGDMPVSIIDMPASIEEGVTKLRGILGELDQSNTVCIRVRDISQIPQSKKLTEAALREAAGSNSMLLVYLVEGRNVDAFNEQVGDSGLVLPRLVERPSDVASYARRFARLSSERFGKAKCAEFEMEAVFFILSYGWEGGYKQLQEAIVNAVTSSEENTPIHVALLRSVLLQEGEFDVAPDSRMAVLMKQAQHRFFDCEMSEGGISAGDLARKLEFDRSVQTRDDLFRMPLVKSELAKL